jgi:hypothetical protein
VRIEGECHFDGAAAVGAAVSIDFLGGSVVSMLHGDVGMGEVKDIGKSKQGVGGRMWDNDMAGVFEFY